MKKIIILSITALMACSWTYAQDGRKQQTFEESTYRRSSLYSLLISHPDKQYNSEIENCFLQIPTPDAYNNQDLSIKIINSEGKLLSDKMPADKYPDGPTPVTTFLTSNDVASRLVGKWFDRNFVTGQCDMNLIGERGQYAASEIDKAKAAASLRGNAMLEDAGQDLIQNTFVLVNDVTYIDRSERSKKAGAIFKLVGAAVAAATNNRSYEDIGNLAGGIVETIKGFSVKVHTYLYRLVWNEETANEFYENWNNAAVFNQNRSKFKLKYIGDQISSGGTTSFLGIREDQPEIMIRKACQRALDENVANLQQNFQAFQIKTPLESVEPLTARVGKKEGITEDSRFEVLEPVKDNSGKMTYKKVGEVKPVQNLIWDNRYMAEEEMAQGATLGYTTFKKVQGGDFLPGFLIRQIK